MNRSFWLASFFSSIAFATPQFADRMKFDGVMHGVYGFYLTESMTDHISAVLRLAAG